MSDLKRVPLSVISGFLGSGKTTLINRLLSANHGVKLTVLVNDFGSINIDASLLKSVSEDTIELTNGCVCCTLSADLFFTIGDLLDRELRPQHILVEASGIADPEKIANVALAEKELRYAGIVTLVDGINIDRQLTDSLISSQVLQQIHSADLLVISKTPARDPIVTSALESHGKEQWVGCDDVAAIIAVLFDNLTATTTHVPLDAVYGHTDYVQWSDSSPVAMNRSELEKRLQNIPSGLLRLKAILDNSQGGCWEVHIVGKQTDIISRSSAPMRGVTIIGLLPLLSFEDLETWWLSGAESAL